MRKPTVSIQQGFRAAFWYALDPANNLPANERKTIQKAADWYTAEMQRSERMAKRMAGR